jgi:hypothetical protein
MALARDLIIMADKNADFLNTIITVLATKKCPEKIVCEHRGSHCKIDKSTERGIKKTFPGMLPKVVQALV